MPASKVPPALIVQAAETPLGALLLVADADGLLRAAEFEECEGRLRRHFDRRLGPAGYALSPGRVPLPIMAALASYFAGDFDAVRSIALKPDGTPFQNEVWAALRVIEPGDTLSYAGLAVRLGRPQSARAVGHANAANPFSIIVPCHRLIGADGGLTGYAGGVRRKRWLLDHEARKPLAVCKSLAI